MCKAIEDMIEQAYKEGFMKGIAEVRISIVMRMLNAGKYDLKDIADLSGMSVEELERLKAGKTI